MRSRSLLMLLPPTLILAAPQVPEAPTTREMSVTEVYVQSVAYPEQFDDFMLQNEAMLGEDFQACVTSILQRIAPLAVQHQVECDERATRLEVFDGAAEYARCIEEERPLHDAHAWAMSMQQVLSMGASWLGTEMGQYALQSKQNAELTQPGFWAPAIAASAPFVAEVLTCEGAAANVEPQAPPAPANGGPPAIGGGAPPESGAGAVPTGEESLPSFPWPPPIPTSKALIPGKLLPSPSPSTTLGQISGRLSEALQAQGYTEMTWFRIPKGFALVTHLERINSDGTPAPHRWVANDMPDQRVGISAYLRRLGLSHVPPGRFRIIVFLVTSATTVPVGTVTREEAHDWLDTGALSLDESTASQPFTRQHQVQVLIYEFWKPRAAGQATFLKHSGLLALDHLRAAGIFGALGG